MTIKKNIVFEDLRSVQRFLGSPTQSKMLSAEITRKTGVVLHLRGTEITLEGGDEAARKQVEILIRQLFAMAQAGTPVQHADVGRALEVLCHSPDAKLGRVFDDKLLTKAGGGRAVAPRSLAQKQYVDSMRTHSLTFGVGPAGTGKTYLAVAMAVRRYLDKDVRRIILTRPAVEAGENLGFLPGTLEEKVSPYMRPLYDALHEMMDVGKIARLIEQGVIEVAPLAYMRGRTLNDAFVILDEAQNTTREQMKMLLTRIGVGTWCVVTGDPTQRDLPGAAGGGLSHALGILRAVPDVAQCQFTGDDVMRHPLVQAIVRAYESDAYCAPVG